MTTKMPKGWPERADYIDSGLCDFATGWNECKKKSDSAFQSALESGEICWMPKGWIERLNLKFIEHKGDGKFPAGWFIEVDDLMPKLKLLFDSGEICWMPERDDLAIKIFDFAIHIEKEEAEFIADAILKFLKEKKCQDG